MRYLLLSFALLLSLNLSAKKVAIVGGGMAGVAAAALLKDAGHEVHLFEARHALGGNAQTVSVPNADGTVIPVDIGPQYFANGAWDPYIDFLKYFKLYDPKDFIEFDTNIVISHEGESWPVLATPRALLNHIPVNLCHNNSSRLLALKNLMDASRELYQSPFPDKTLSVEEWLNHPYFDEVQRDAVFLPFLASILGTTIEQTKSLSALSLAHLYAFRSPTLCAGTKFSVSKLGMGEIIRRVGNLLKRQKRVAIHLNSPIAAIVSTGSGYRIEAQDKEYLFDGVISAVHPSTLADLVSDDDLKDDLLSLPYISARVVIHRDHTPEFENNDYPAHFTAMIDARGEVMTTMNLEEIDKRRFRGLLKSWVNSDVVFSRMGNVLEKVEFQHPLMTPSFLQTVDVIKENIKSDTYGLGAGFAIAGGWTQVHETQSTAILSAFEAVTQLGLLSESEKESWKGRLKIR